MGCRTADKGDDCTTSSRVSCATTTACCHTVVSDGGTADPWPNAWPALTVVPTPGTAVFPSMFPPPKGLQIALLLPCSPFSHGEAKNGCGNKVLTPHSVAKQP